MDIRRGEIFYIKKAETIGHEQEAGRPAIIVSNDIANERSGTAEVVYLTTQPKRDLVTHVIIRATGRESTALCEQITTVSGARIGEYVGTCSHAEMEAIDRALLMSLGIELASAEYDALKEPVQNTVEIERDIYKRLYEQLVDKMAR